ncbi:MAG TPA: hypothetical protein VMS65_03875 [Polyangiaceae bacterium]|nr:hypothetical protein [Polyangiaceae bacterium]
MKSKAQLLGAILGVTAMSGFVLWQRSRPSPCTGGVTIELRPPLAAPGPYHFHLELEGIRQPCELEVPFPIQGRVDTTTCGHAVELRTRVQGEESKIVGLTIGASPETLSFRVTRKGEVLYDAALTPKYGPYETLPSESRLFCGERALVAPPCVRGSSACAPYEPACDGPEDCSGGKTCCANPDFGREYGPLAATECSSARRCLDRFGFVACHTDADCPSDMTCADASLTKDFKRPLTACRSKSAH